MQVSFLTVCSRREAKRIAAYIIKRERGNFSMNTIITIGRQFGSGGREIGKKVAEYFEIKFYDRYP